MSIEGKDLSLEFFNDLLGVDDMELPKAHAIVTLQEFDKTHRKYMPSDRVETSMAIVEGNMNEDNCRIVLVMPPDMRKDVRKIKRLIKRVEEERANPPSVGGALAPANITLELRAASTKYITSSYLFAHSPRDVIIEEEGFLFNKTAYATFLFFRSNVDIQAAIDENRIAKEEAAKKKRKEAAKKKRAKGKSNNFVNNILGDSPVEDEEEDIEEDDETNVEKLMDGLDEDERLSCNILVGAEDPEKELNSLIGLDGIKDKLEQMEARMLLDQRKMQANVGEQVSANRHMIFYGEPGTGKTTVARIITGILYNMGFIRENKCIEVNGEFLKGRYHGSSAPKTQKMINRALGGVLFIDEAYAIMDNFSSGGGFGEEVINTLLTNMENHKDDLIIIFAGYKDEMGEFLEQNPGLKSRISDQIEFVKYQPEELLSIFDMRLQKHGFNITSEARIEVYNRLYDAFLLGMTSGDNGNARYAVNTVERVLDAHAILVKDLDDDDPKNFIIGIESVKKVFERQGVYKTLEPDQYVQLEEGIDPLEPYYEQKVVDDAVEEAESEEED